MTAGGGVRGAASCYVTDAGGTAAILAHFPVSCYHPIWKLRMAMEPF
jgi:hypothetical protein